MDEYYMKEAMKEALKAKKIGEIPVGAVIVKNSKIIARGYNKKEKKQNSIMHAEIIAINRACKKTKSWRLNGCKLYVTLEPCSMCMGAIIESRIENMFYSIKNSKSHATNLSMISNNKLKVDIGLLEFENMQILNDFFKNMRNK